MTPESATLPPEDSLHSARQAGRRAAEDFVLRLETAENRERERRLTELAWRPASLDDDHEDRSLEVLRLEARVDELTGYVRAVEGSLVWRTTQWVRRLFGRAW